MTPLCNIAKATGTDKFSLHSYCERYWKLLSPIRLKPVVLLEIGILGGESLEMWAQMFPHAKARIIGIDIHDRGYRPLDNRIELYFGDASQKDRLDSIPGEFDVVIDDGSHFSSHQIDSFTHLWPRVKPGGMYCIEDLHCVHSVQHCTAHINFIEYLAKIAMEMQDPNGATGSGKFNPEHLRSDIDEISISKGMAVIRKRP